MMTIMMMNLLTQVFPLPLENGVNHFLLKTLINFHLKGHLGKMGALHYINSGFGKTLLTYVHFLNLF